MGKNTDNDICCLWYPRLHCLLLEHGEVTSLHFHLINLRFYIPERFLGSFQIFSNGFTAKSTTLHFGEIE